MPKRLPATVTGVFGRLRRNIAGNTLALAAAAMIPLIGMVGGALDLSRLYMTKVRLQHACDAGALAGRKRMGGGSWDTTSRNSATEYFRGNFTSGSYGTTTATPTYTSSGSNVHGTATTTVPMTLMTLFSFPPKTLTVTCDTAMQLPNTDVVFVLDVTGSMANQPSGASAGGNPASAKINVLKNAVKCFYESLAQAKISDATGCPSNSYLGINSDAQLRFGFVPYSTNVNISQLNLPASYFASTWTYQSRSKTDWTDWSNTSAACSPRPADTATQQYQPVTINGSCRLQTRTKGSNLWLYAKTSFPIDVGAALSSFASATVPTAPTPASVTLPGIGPGFANRQLTWDGCVEEAAPTSDIDQKPDTPATRYAPVLPDAIYLRQSTAADSNDPNTSSFSRADVVSSSNFYNGLRTWDAKYVCTTPAQKLRTLDLWTPAVFKTYVNSLQAAGTTYHDVGMLWGGRLISPAGIFGSDNTTTPAGGVIQRNVIFMTDGDAQAAGCDYTTYGVAYWDQRTNSTVVPNCASAKDTALTADVNTRLVPLCTAIKNEPNTLLWVISFGGTGIADDTKNRLRSCATDTDHYYDATDATKLKSAFQDIAARIARLRLEH